MRVLSLFDGMSCGQLALNRAGLSPTVYYAAETDPYPIKVTQRNFPSTVQLGDVEGWRDWDLDWSTVDLVMGGSPCQGFSFAGKGLAFDDPRSKLFFVFDEIRMHVLMHNPAAKFFLENVFMKKEHEAVITERLGVDPVKANSNLVSAQNRRRNYWFNWEAPLPADRGVTWGDIREHAAPARHYYRPGGLAWIARHAERTGKKLDVWPDDAKCQMLEASMHKGYSSQRFFGVQDVGGLRYMSLTECERAQTVPEGYTEGVSDTRRYIMLGNGWTVEMVAHFLRYLK